MRNANVCLALIMLAATDSAAAFIPNTKKKSASRIQKSWRSVTSIQQDTSKRVALSEIDNDSTTTTSSSSTTTTTPRGTTITIDDSPRILTQQLISALPYRELIHELRIREQSTTGTTSQLRMRLRQIAIPDQMEECVVNEDGIDDDDCVTAEMNQILTFTDVSDEVQELIDDISVKSSQGHWKAATRKLKKLSRRVGVDRPIPEETLMQVLNVCMANRLQGARASEPTRKVMEQLVENGYGIAEEVGNYCIKNCLSDTGPKSTHQGFGGIDTALAMKAALEVAGTPIQTESNYKIMIALAKEGSIESAIEILRKLVIDENDTPPLPTLVAFSQAIAMVKVPTDATKIVEVLGYVKAAGYDLDTIANVEDGRNLLANAIIAAERINNDSLGFRLLSAAGNVKLEETNERGDALVSNVSPITRRAAISIHRRTIVKSIDSGEWKVAVKVLELMVLRKLTPSPSLWRSVVTCCAKEGKSRKATALLLDWVKLYNKGEAEKPPLAVFNTVINACEICNEQELTLLVLDSMKSTHDTDGNLITFNIALKRLAKLGNYIACEGIVVGMLKAKVMPSVVTYTTAIAACVFKGNKQPGLAYEWLRRMRVQGINPNVMTYNTALAACLDTTLDSTRLASKIATEMLLDVDEQLQQVDVEFDEYRSVIPDLQTKDVARRLMQQLKQNWEAGDIEKRIAVESIRVPLLKLVDFQKSELGERARQLVARRADSKLKETEVTTKMELEIESLASHRFAEV